MQHNNNNLKMVSLNVNGLNNTNKRNKIINKFKREKMQVVLLQETHLSNKEHEKLKRFGFKNTFYSSYNKQSNRRGVAILVANTTKFELTKEICDKDGRYILIKGKLEDQLVTLISVYAPPESGKPFFETLFSVINKEAEGIWICGGDINVTLNYNLDSTSTHKNKKIVNKYINTMMAEMGIIDVWRELHPLQRDYSHYSAPHRMYSRIDVYFMSKEDRHRVKECEIGVSDLSDHSAVYITMHLKNRKKSTVWRLNVGTLNNNAVVEDTKKEINTYKEQNDNGEVDPTILWDAMKAVIRGKLIAQSTQIKKARLEIYQQKINKLKTLEQQHKRTMESEVLDQIKKIRKEIDELLMMEVERKSRFLKQTYYEGGSKATRMLAHRIRKQQALNNIHKIRDPTSSTLLYDPEEIEKVFEDYYRTLYTQPKAADEEEMELFLNSLDLPTCGTTPNKILNAPITVEEVETAIQRAKNNKSPGTDGFPSEFYKTFKEELMPLLVSTFNYTHREGKIPPSWKEAIISVIHKEGKDKEYCSNYRPISVLNMDYKLYTSIISKRLENCMTELIDEDQTGFIKGRQTQDNIRRALHVVDEIQRAESEAVLVSIDAEKAFDSVNWKFLYKVMARLGFNEKSIQKISALYQEPTARIKINGSLSNRIKLERSTRQGCCLSPTLFALFIEPLAQVIRENTDIIGVTVKGREQKVGLFADDVILYLEKPDQCLPKLMQLLEDYGKYSGYKLNIAKTQILALNYSPQQDIRNRYKINWNLQAIKYLGVNITKTREGLYDANYTPINRAIKRDLERWSVLCLDFSSRIEIIKMNILPRLLYLFQSLPIMVPKKQFDEWDKWISRFVWGGKKPRTRYETLQLPKDRGGMALPNLREYFNAAQIRPLTCWCNTGIDPSRWKEMELEFEGYKIQHLLADKNQYMKLMKDLDPITKFTIEIWYAIVKKHKLEKEIKILSWPAYDTRFKPGLIDQGYKRLAKWNDITAICTVIRQGKMQSFEDLRVKHDLEHREFFRYLQMRDYFEKEIKTDWRSEVILIMTQAYIKKQDKVISALYQGLMASKNNSTLYIKKKWESGFGMQITDKDWDNICETQCTATSSRMWREFCWKNITRYFITPKIKAKMQAGQQSCWRQCGAMDVDHEHIFWNCPKINSYWHNIWIDKENIEIRNTRDQYDSIVI